MIKQLVIVLFLIVLSNAREDETTSSYQFVAFEKIYCETVESTASNEEEVFNYDCSHRDLTRFTLSRLMEHIRASTILNLAYNSIGAHSPALRNLTFNIFKQLKRLNLTSNGLESAESHSFFYIDKITDTVDTSLLHLLDPSQLRPLRLTVLDLSRNLFTRVPWDSIRSLPHLTVLYLNENPIRSFDFGDWKPSSSPQTYTDIIEDDYYTDEPIHTKLFRNLTEIYLSSAHIENVEPAIFSYLPRLRLLDLSNNQIRHLSQDLRPPLNALASFENLYVDGNPLACDCRLIWLKEFLESKQRSGRDSDRLRRTMCQINTKASKKNSIIETKVIYINSTYKSNENYFKLTNINHLNSARSINKSSNTSNFKMVRISELPEEQFYCDLDLSGQVKDLTLLNDRAHYRQEIEITCRVRSFPEAKIKWLFGQRDLDKMFTYENKQFSTEDTRNFNSTEKLFIIDSKLLVSYSGHIGKVNFSCRAFYLPPTVPVPTLSAQPTHLLKTILFNINSDDDRLDMSHDGDYSGDSDEYSMNSTVLMMKEGLDRGYKERPLIYWVVLGICVFLIFVALILMSVCVIRHFDKKRRKEREADISHYAYSTYTTSNYSTINKRSAMYLNTNHHQNSKTGTLPINELSSSSSAMIPLKPDVIREHKEHSSIYYRISSSSPNEYSTPAGVLTNRSTPIYSTDTTPVIYTVEPGRGGRPPRSTGTIDAPSLISRTTMATTPSTTEESMSSADSSKRDSTRSSKSFEENIDEYLEPECPDLSKPEPKSKHSSSPSRPTNL